MLSGHKVVALSDAEQKEQKENFKAYTEGMVKLEPGGWFLMNQFLPLMDSYYTFKFKPTDVVVMTFPKCGTTWTLEMIWTMRNNPNLDHKNSDQLVDFKCPFIDLDPLMMAPTMPNEDIERVFMPTFNKLCPGKDPQNGICLQVAEKVPEPRTLKTHLPFSLLDPKLIDTCKVVYVARNPKDVCVSYYHHNRILNVHSYVGSFDKFVDLFVSDKLQYSPFGENMNEAWELRDHKNLLFIFYEDIKANPKKMVTKLSEFIGTELTPAQIENVLYQSSFKVMQAAEDPDDIFTIKQLTEVEGGFFRQGKTGGYKDKMTKEHEKKIEEWARRTFPNIPFKF